MQGGTRQPLAYLPLPPPLPAAHAAAAKPASTLGVCCPLQLGGCHHHPCGTRAMAFAGAPGRRPGEEAFFSPMGAQLPTVIGGQTAAAAAPPPLALGRGLPPSSTAAGTHSKLAAQELYWRWFQMADSGALPVAFQLAVPQQMRLGQCWPWLPLRRTSINCCRLAAVPHGVQTMVTPAPARLQTATAGWWAAMQYSSLSAVGCRARFWLRWVQPVGICLRMLASGCG